MKTTKKAVAVHNANAANVWKERSDESYKSSSYIPLIHLHYQGVYIYTVDSCEAGRNAAEETSIIAQK